MTFYPVAEKFISINGEGQKAGMIAAFIRMGGCNLSCSYCDTAWANTPDCPCTDMGAKELLSWLFSSNVKNVTLTGGEPLLIHGISDLITAIGNAGIDVEIETNGSVYLKPFCSLHPRPAFTMDYKCPGSGMERFMEHRNFSLLTPKDIVKFVVSDQNDLKKALEICEKYHLNARCQIYLSAVFGRIEPKEIVSFMITHHWNAARLQLQMHKFIWPPNQRGV